MQMSDIVKLVDTPLGEVALYFDDRRVDFAITAVPKNQQLYPDILQAYYMSYDYVADHKAHTLKCMIANADIQGYSDSGENLEATSFYTDTVKLTIGIEGDFAYYDAQMKPVITNYDYYGNTLTNGIEVNLTEFTQDRCFTFGIAWIIDYTDQNEYQTWYAADPTLY